MPRNARRTRCTRLRKSCNSCYHAKVKCNRYDPMCQRCFSRGFACVYPHSPQNNRDISKPQPTSNFHIGQHTPRPVAQMPLLQAPLPQAPIPQNGIPGNHLPQNAYLQAVPGPANPPPFDPGLINHQPLQYGQNSVGQDGDSIHSSPIATAVPGPQWASTLNSPGNTAQQDVNRAIGAGVIQYQSSGYDSNSSAEQLVSGAPGEITLTNDSPVDDLHNWANLEFGDPDFTADDNLTWSYPAPEPITFHSAAPSPGSTQHNMEQTNVFQPISNYMHPWVNGSATSTSGQGATNAATGPGSVPGSVSTAARACTCIQESIQVTSRFWAFPEMGMASDIEVSAACLKVLSCHNCIRIHTGLILGKDLPTVCASLRRVLDSYTNPHNQEGEAGSLQPGEPASLTWLRAQRSRLEIIFKKVPEQGSMKAMISILYTSVSLGMIYEAVRVANQTS